MRRHPLKTSQHELHVVSSFQSAQADSKKEMVMQTQSCLGDILGFSPFYTEPVWHILQLKFSGWGFFSNSVL